MKLIYQVLGGSRGAMRALDTIGTTLVHHGLLGRLGIGVVVLNISIDA